MTAEVVVVNKSAIALAADSAATISNGDGDSIKTYGANKLFAMSKFKPIGVMIYSDSELMGMPGETIGYDLNKPGQDYTDLIAAIKTTGSWWHYLDSTWIVVSQMTAAQIRDSLSRYLDSSDELLVAVLSSPAAWVGFNSQASEWLKDNL